MKIIIDPFVIISNQSLVQSDFPLVYICSLNFFYIYNIFKYIVIQYIRFDLINCTRGDKCRK